ncbi:uncharacterized protein LOC120710326 [Panicum virgatum]|uniref:uncharacterized protein LOC120710326 n=1 Tax=Panicum virgatum TaxID=38727 RepID=UPI0019D5F875|nr:uncharacterized protein LOC120710326 [Panicum virgatum]
MAGRKRRQWNPASYLSDDLLIEILVRLPARPLRRFKFVSRSWRDLISGPVRRRRLAHTDAASGFFFYQHVHGDGYLAPVTTTDLSFTALLCPPDGGGGGGSPSPSLDQAFPFLPCSSGTWTRTELLDSCNGLLLLRCHRPGSDGELQAAPPLYIVCDPATQGWVVELPPVPLPEPSRRRDHVHIADLDFFHHQQQRLEHTRPAALAFDPAVSPHFHVLELVEDDGRRQYSSRKSEWSYRISYAGENACFNGSEWRYSLAYAGKHAYLNGSLHLTTTDTENGMVVVASVDTKGQTWRATRVCPATLGAPGVIAQSQRRLLYADTRDLSVYVLEDGGAGAGAERWILKHRACRALDDPDCLQGQSVVAIHPDCNVIFLFDRRRRSLIAYDMDHGTTRLVHSFMDATAIMYHFFPYIPLYLQ